MSTTYPSLDDVLEAHRKALESTGGASGVRYREGIEAALDRMKQTLFGEEAYPTLCEKAAAFFETLLQRHPFVDGNKRTAVRTVYAFLAINGRRITATQEEVVEMTRSVAAGEYEVDALADWFEAHTEPIDD